MEVFRRRPDVAVVTCDLCVTDRELREKAVSRQFPGECSAAHILPLPIFAMLLATVLCNRTYISEALYLCAHKREPFILSSIAIGVLTACSTVFMGKYWGATGVTHGYFCTSGVFGLAYGTYIFITTRLQWHITSAFEGISSL